MHNKIREYIPYTKKVYQTQICPTYDHEIEDKLRTVNTKGQSLDDQRRHIAV